MERAAAGIGEGRGRRCGRFTQNYTWEEVYAFLKVFGTPRNLRPHYNIAPTTNVDVIPLDREGRRELVSMRWGWGKAGALPLVMTRMLGLGPM
jgi:hypothetical protein